MAQLTEAQVKAVRALVDFWRTDKLTLEWHRLLVAVRHEHPGGLVVGEYLGTAAVRLKKLGRAAYAAPSADTLEQYLTDMIAAMNDAETEHELLAFIHEREALARAEDQAMRQEEAVKAAEMRSAQILADDERLANVHETMGKQAKAITDALSQLEQHPIPRPSQFRSVVWKDTGWVYEYESGCWRCKCPISSLTDKRCLQCGRYICSECGACFCHRVKQ